LENKFLIAQIKSVLGSDGFLQVKSYSDIPDRFENLEQVEIDVFGGLRIFYIEESGYHKNNVILKFKNFNSPDDVRFLVGRKMFLTESSSDKLPKNFHYIHDLIGSKVFRNGKFFGYLIDVLCLPAHDVYVIEDDRGKEILIPAVENYIEHFDAEEKNLILREGSEPFYDDED
jgi:16S rRNA processing protein RimM